MGYYGASLTNKILSIFLITVLLSSVGSFSVFQPNTTETQTPIMENSGNLDLYFQTKQMIKEIYAQEEEAPPGPPGGPPGQGGGQGQGKGGNPHVSFDLDTTPISRAIDHKINGKGRCDSPSPGEPGCNKPEDPPELLIRMLESKELKDNNGRMIGHIIKTETIIIRR